MNNTHLVGRMQKIALRGFVLALFAFSSSMAFAQTSVVTLVDAATAVDRLTPHYSAVAANLNATNEKASNYAYEQVRAEFTMHIFEDAQLGIDPAQAIQSRLDGTSTISPGAVDGAISPRGNWATIPGSNNAGISAISDPIVQELISILQQ